MGQSSSGWALAILFGGSAACTVAHYETGNDSDAYDAADGATADLTVYRDTIAPLDSNPADRIQTADIVSPPPDVPLRTDAVVDIPIVPDVPPPPDVVATNDVVSEPDAPPEASMADVACGAPGQACCMPGNACDAGSECLSTQTCATCGGDGDRCCTGNPACTDSAASCVTVPNHTVKRCVLPANGTTTGGPGELCTNLTTCSASDLQCANATCILCGTYMLSCCPPQNDCYDGTTCDSLGNCD